MAIKQYGIINCYIDWTEGVYAEWRYPERGHIHNDNILSDLSYRKTRDESIVYWMWFNLQIEICVLKEGGIPQF